MWFYKLIVKTLNYSCVIDIFICLFSFCLFQGYLGECAVKIWRHDNDILNPDHWIGGKSNQECDGLDLRDAQHTLLVIDQLDVKQVLFPNYTKIYLPEGARISLHEDGVEEIDCKYSTGLFSCKII